MYRQHLENKGFAEIWNDYKENLYRNTYKTYQSGSKGCHQDLGFRTHAM